MKTIQLKLPGVIAIAILLLSVAGCHSGMQNTGNNVEVTPDNGTTPTNGTTDTMSRQSTTNTNTSDSIRTDSSKKRRDTVR